MGSTCVLSPNGLNENTVIAAAKRGQTAAFDELWQSHTKRILRTTYRITRNREDAEDALQDSFLRAFLHIKDFDGRSSFSTWLTRIAINSALMILRKKRSALELSIDDPGNHDSESSVSRCSGPRSGSRRLLCTARARRNSPERDPRAAPDHSAGYRAAQAPRTFPRGNGKDDGDLRGRRKNKTTSRQSGTPQNIETGNRSLYSRDPPVSVFAGCMMVDANSSTSN